MPNRISRRAILVLPAASLLQGCGAALPPIAAPDSAPQAMALLAQAAAAHGGAALTQIADVSVSYEGAWHGFVNSLQPDLVDAGFRGQSQERWLLQDRRVGQAHTGPRGHKQVARQMAAHQQGDIRVWFNGMQTQDDDKRAAAALVVDGYSLFLLGPMLLAGQWTAQRSLQMELAEPQRLSQDGREYGCDVLRMRLSPGFGLSEADELAVYLDREDHVMRSVRFTLNGLDGTKGAIAQVDTMDYRMLRGVRWPTRFYERLLRPLPVPVHDWRMTGLDLNRGLMPAEIDGPAFSGKAIAPAAVLATT